jgi:hypothetical protein
MNNISQISVEQIGRGFEGQLADCGLSQQLADAKIDGQTAQVITVTITGSANGAAYSVEVPELATLVEFLGGASDTASATNLATAWNASPQARGFALATSAAGVVTLTAVYGWSAASITVVPSSSVMAVAQVSAGADPDDYPVAVAVYLNANGEATRTPPSGGAATLTPTVQNSALYAYTIRFSDGLAVRVSYTSDGSATAQEIVEGLDAAAIAAAPANRITSTENNATQTLSSSTHSFTLTDVTANLTPSAESEGVDLLRRLAGFSIRDYQNERPLGQAAAYHPGPRRVSYVRTGGLFVLSGSSAIEGDLVYLGIDAGNAAEFGKLHDAAAAGRIQLPASAARFGPRPNVVELRLGR